LDKIEHTNTDKIPEKIRVVCHPDNYNKVPENLREISEEDFYHIFFTRCPTHRGFKQIWPQHSDLVKSLKKGLMTLHLWVYCDATGIAIGEWSAKDKMFFAFGCEHENTHEIIGNCLHRYTCVKCGHVSVVDSSG
jgi:hypothetical protein